MKVKFREIANFVAGQSPKSEYYSESDGVPFLQGNRTFGTFHPTIDTYTTKTTKIANKGDILMSVRAPVGDLNFAPVDLCIGRGLAAITAKDGDNAFLFYALKYNINNLLKQSNGTTYDSVTGDIVKEMDMIIPEDKSVCKKISKLLYTIDSKIENNKQTMAELESMAKTIYDYWFLQYEFPNEEGKPYKSSGGKMVYSEELKKEIPEGWTIGTLSDIAEFIMGQSPKSSAYNELGKGLPLINGAVELTSSGININKYTTEYNRVCKVNDLLFCIRATLGNIQFADREYCLGRGVASARPKEEMYVEYVYQVLNYMINYFESILSGSIIVGMTKDDISDFTTILPPKNIMDRFHNISKENIITCRKLKDENKELQNLRDFLLPLLMNGQVNFKN